MRWLSGIIPRTTEYVNEIFLINVQYVMIKYAVLIFCTVHVDVRLGEEFIGHLCVNQTMKYQFIRIYYSDIAW